MTREAEVQRLRRVLSEEHETITEIERAAARHGYDPDSETVVEWLGRVRLVAVRESEGS